MWKEFKQFIMRGNVLDLAVGVVIGAAFTAIVNSLVKDIITPIIVAITGNADLTGLSFKLGKADFTYGNFLQAVVNFLLIALVLFMMIQAINRLKRKQPPEEPVEVEAEVPVVEQYLKEIRDSLLSQNNQNNKTE
ncbi:large-conductance mechanosensitive channel [Trichococcus palustris]|jgi:large conductance mechanosensitive channel|uniref:Large-conductance mechanosensitive channel n=1 Tax=Trichococcus palustris TaxID=140314 RepID=A0A143YMZ9_9LACT|nr:large conductance mechanosensitive channel protein MscL [Trichococcus palustris]CZQ94178.1 large-conductance mechanosensitive channel [Trichococcus palustris]SFL18338.1 large conductance mechanosensitive channel [Trichococcus palustris]